MNEFKDMKPTSQGTLGVGVAIGYYSSNGYVVSIPLSDNQKYDLLVDISDEIKRVQVKTTGYKPKGKYLVQLKTVCPKKTSKNVITTFDNTKVDIVFILTAENDMYHIPAKDIKTKSCITLNEKYEKYKI